MELLKGQKVRVLDVFLFAPLMIYAGVIAKGLPMWLRVALVVMGIGTAIYNGYNWLKNR